MADLVEWSYHKSAADDTALEEKVSEALRNMHEMPLDLHPPASSLVSSRSLWTCNVQPGRSSSL